MSGYVSRRGVLGAGIAAVPVLSMQAGGARAEAGAGAPRVTDSGAADVRATDPGAYISFSPVAGAFSLVGVPVVVSPEDHPGVVRVAGDLRDDIERVTGVRPGDAVGPEVVLVGT